MNLEQRQNCYFTSQRKWTDEFMTVIRFLFKSIFVYLRIILFRTGCVLTLKLAREAKLAIPVLESNLTLK